MRVLYLSDRLSVRGGADQHLRQVIEWAVAQGADVRMGFGRLDEGVSPPAGCTGMRIKGLATAVSSPARLAGLRELLEWADLVHVQNVMNPVVLAAAAATGRALVTVQDHRLFCPGAGKTMPDGSRCETPLAAAPCHLCLPDASYRQHTLQLTRARLAALDGMALVVLSRYMADELSAVGRPGARLIAPWVEVSTAPPQAGNYFLIAGRLVAHKGVVEAWRAWRDAAVELTLEVAGAGPLADRLLGATQHGWLDSRRLTSCLRGSRALLFTPTWQEPFGILGVEALAQGTAVVVAATGGAAEWADAGCVQVAPGDPQAMTAAIRQLAGDPELAMSLGRRGRAAVRRRCARSLVEPLLSQLYQEVGDGSAPPPCAAVAGLPSPER